MADDTQLLYLEPDDEITTVVRRLREAEAARVVLVASGRTKATTSAVALRLLAQVAAEEGREVVLVADPAARALAAEAGIPAFASVADANVEGAVALPPTPTPQAPIHVVRGEPAPASVDQTAIHATSAPPAPLPGLDDTQAVPVPQPAPRARARPAPGRGGPPGGRSTVPRALLAALLVPLVLAGAAIAMVMPAASIIIERRPVAVGPLSYNVRPDVHPSDAEPLESKMEGEATGHRTRRTAARGSVTFRNYAPAVVFVPAGTVVSAGGEIFFETTEGVNVPDSSFFFPGEADAEVVAVNRGPEGNVAADAIDRVEDKEIDRALRDGAGAQNRRVLNRDPTSGGEELELVVVQRSDVTDVAESIAAELNRQLADLRSQDAERLYPTSDAPKPKVDVPDDLIGHVSEGPFSFELAGRLVDEQPFVQHGDAEAAATARFHRDAAATPPGTALDESTIRVELGEATLDGDSIRVEATVTAQAVPQVDEDVLRTELAGMTADEAEAVLAPIGPSQVELWPPWVDRVPQLDWRVSIEVRAAEPAGAAE
jgi:hypothetical protein